MSWKDWVCAGFIILGIILFLYGGNYYNNLAGWAGVFLVFGGILALILIYVYSSLVKRGGKSGEAQAPHNP